MFSSVTTEGQNSASITEGNLTISVDVHISFNLQSHFWEFIHRKTCSYRLNVCVPPKCISWNLIPNMMMVFGSGVFGRWLGHEGGALMNGISALTKETPESSLAPSTMWGHRNQEVGPYRTLNLPAPWSLTSQLPKLLRIEFLFISHPVYGSLTAQTD